MFYHDNLSGFALSADVQSDFDQFFSNRGQAIWDDFCLGLNKGVFPFLTISEDTDDLTQAQAIFESSDGLCAAGRILVLGTGGSSLSGQALLALHRHPFGNGRPPHVDFLDNIDPHTFAQLMETLNPHETAMVAISKSGETAETLCQFLTLIDYYKKSGVNDVEKRCIVMTEDKPSTLKQLCDEGGFFFLPHPKTIGGRFSALSLVGLLPFIMAGYDGAAVRRGAGSFLKGFIAAGPAVHNTPLSAAIWAGVLARKKAITLSVMMPYVDRLIPFSAWYCQLWGESLGKKGQGITPLRALGTVDQHSQLQLYLDGPKDKMITLVGTQTAQMGRALNGAGFNNKTMGDLMAAELQATYQTLKNHGCPVRMITLPAIGDESMGALLAAFMVELVLTAMVLGVDAPFDQDAVEESKRLTRLYLQGTHP